MRFIDVLILILLMMFVGLVVLANAQVPLLAEVSVPSNIQSMQKVKTFGNLCDAIYWAEGGDLATYKYGIRSVSYDSTTEAREICLRTVRNTLEKYAKIRCKGFEKPLECLARRYCPIGAENDPKGINKNWLRNVRGFLAHPKAVNHE